MNLFPQYNLHWAHPFLESVIPFSVLNMAGFETAGYFLSHFTGSCSAATTNKYHFKITTRLGLVLHHDILRELSFCCLKE